jgi:hypothetical protein
MMDEDFSGKYPDVFEALPATINLGSLNRAISLMQKTSTSDLSNMKLHSSNACSAVLESNENADVFQYFCSKGIVEKICSMMERLSSDPIIKLPIMLRTGFGRTKVVHIDTIIEYNIFDYLSPFRYCIPEDHMVVWGKLKTLNSIPMKERGEFITDNLPKILWDIGKALYGLHKHKIVHNDCVIDNMGIHNGKFALFDFDGSIEPTENKGLDSDITTLYKSISFYNPKLQLPRTTGKNLVADTLVWYADNVTGKDYQLAFDTLEAMTII